MKSITKYSETIIKISGFVEQLDQSVRAEAFKFLLAQEYAQSSEKVVLTEVAPAAAHQREARSRTMAPQELIRKCDVSSFTDKAVVLAYWLEEYQQKSVFSIGDLRAVFDQAREQLPKNLSDMVIKLETTARIMKADKVGTVQNYKLTGTAIHEIESKLKSADEVK